MIEKPDIAAILEHYGSDPAPTRHRWTAIKCPLHDDRSASASVNTETGKFKCFACDFSGDGIDLVMRQEGIKDFSSAVERCEAILGRSLDQVLPGSKARTRRNRLSQDTGNIRGQRSLLQARGRRKPLTGT